MSIDFDSRKFENPSIQRFYSGLQSFALNEKPEEVQDTLEPDYEGMKRMQPVIDKMKDAFFGGSNEDGLSKIPIPKTRKRKVKEEDKQELSNADDGISNENQNENKPNKEP